MKVVILGVVGAGKGSYSKILAKDYGFKHLSAGDILRKEVESGSGLGKEIKERIDAGKFVDDKLMLDLLSKEIGDSEDVVFDGFPRNLKQAQLLDSRVKVDKVVFLDISDEAIIERLEVRKICKECGRIYGLNIPAPDEKCECGGALYQREDDKPEVVKKRLEVYHRLTEPLIDYYSEKGLLVKIDADGGLDVVFERVKKVLGLG